LLKNKEKKVAVEPFSKNVKKGLFLRFLKNLKKKI